MGSRAAPWFGRTYRRQHKHYNLVRFSMNIPVVSHPNLLLCLALSLPTLLPSTVLQTTREAQTPQAVGWRSGKAGRYGVMLRAMQHGILTLPIPTHAHTEMMSTYIALVPGNFIPVISHSARYCTDIEQAAFFFPREKSVFLCILV